MIYPLLQLEFQSDNKLQFAEVIEDALTCLSAEIEEVLDEGNKIICPILLVNQNLMDSIIKEASLDEKGTTLQELWIQGAASIELPSFLLEYVEEIYPRGELFAGQAVICLDIERIYSLAAAVGHHPETILQALWHRERIRSSWGLKSHAGSINRKLWGVLLQELLIWARGYQRIDILVFLEEVAKNLIFQPSKSIGLKERRKDNIGAPKLKEPEWLVLIEKLREAQFKCFQIQADPPEKEKPARKGHFQLHQDLFDIFSNQEEGLYRESSGDTLALYVAQDSRSGLQKGIHLFCDRIEKAAKKHHMPLEVLIWQVFWHELTHWKLDDSKDPCGKRSFLQSLDIREVFCEITGIEALKGKESFLHPTLKTPRTIRFADASHIVRWRKEGNLNPYSWFLGMQGYKGLVSQEVWFRAILYWSQQQYQIQQKLEQGKKPSLAEKTALRDIFNLYTAKTTFPLAKQQIEQASQQAGIQKSWLGQPIVYLWRKNG